jgi:hypothetical protein
VNTIAISGTDIYAGGQFTTIGGQSRNLIAKLNNTTSAADATWNPNANGLVNTIATSGTDIYAGGSFTTIGGQTRNRIAKLNNTNGNADATWNANSNNSITTIAISGANIYAGGNFGTIGGQNRGRIAKLNNTTGAADVAWDASTINTVNAIVISGADLYAGGNFTSIGGFTQSFFAQFIDGLVPVELSSFTSNINMNNVILNWSTVMEENNSGFDIERKSSNNNNWIKLTNIQGHGTSNNSHSYSYEDRNILTGNYNYRLKQIDFNGNYKYYDLSNEVIIGLPVKFELSQNYPNPFNPSTSINFELPAANFVSLKIYDMTGKEVANVMNEVKEAGYYSVNFNASMLSSGIYFYSIKAGNFVSTKKMMLVK